MNKGQLADAEYTDIALHLNLTFLSLLSENYEICVRVLKAHLGTVFEHCGYLSVTLTQWSLHFTCENRLAHLAIR